MARQDTPATVLIVDDEEVVRELLRQALAGAGRTLLLADSRQQALDLVKAHGHLDVAVIDKNLEVISGLELARDLRERFPLCETIIVTAAPSFESAVEAIGLRIFDYLTKPFHVREIQQKVAAALALVKKHREQQQRLRHLYQMEAIGSLTASMAHELNNPLTCLMANLHAIPDACSRLRQAPNNQLVDEVQELALEAKESADRIATIVRDLRFFAERGETDTIGPVAIDQVVESAFHFLDNQLRHRARLVSSLGQPPPVLGSELRLGQILVNLLLNAVQALDEATHKDQVIKVRTGLDDDGWVFAEIADTGRGIPASHQERVFERFFTTKESAESAGLGLAICKRYIDEMGGRIELSSKVGEGTRVTVRVPAAQHATELVEAKPAIATRPPENPPPGQILVIDDDAMLLRAIKRILSGFDVTLVDNGRRAIEILTGQHTFDVVLCDLMMPGKSGMDVYDQCRKKDPATADEIIFITGGVFSGKAVVFREQISNRFLEKPIDREDLRALVTGRLRTKSRMPRRRAL